MSTTTRRALLALAALAPAAARAAADGALAEAIREAVGEAPIEDGGIVLRAPAVAENGGQVPVTVLVESPMTASDHVAAIHILATRNPTPGVASFHLSPLLARAEVQTRIRLAEEQRIIVLAQMNDGRVRRAVAEVRVTTGGCLT
ncbi:sulfur oxidation protein SoxY [Roseomonas alkaliterrae]|uniref:Sulfur-oxidizing protein SoxY n=1 Tax=Neoroseomonas alkaliterrae TaxID=1452450 RepID=A0A840XUV3_9PROT|nr:thiosulfate oxidation carrier protein SoxY [Neoroseomonas alkaliterrae]MBB5690850.1 sulfur-oxidizing protein SoxY [Neoroseomonas alkaliterrae]MBR0677863.1 sulfur oxidation protein SoxY [Neoroseomonas alkaliterrae]